MFKSEMFAVERRAAELNEARKIDLFFRFKNEVEKNKAMEHIREVRGFQDEFKRLIDLRNDQDPAHISDGIELRFDKYDSRLLGKVQDYLKAQGFEVTGSNEWIREPEESKKEQEKISPRIIYSDQKDNDNVVDMFSKRDRRDSSGGKSFSKAA